MVQLIKFFHLYIKLYYENKTMFEFLYIRINKNLKIKMNKYDNDYKELINDI